MIDEICLLVVFNHRYDENLERLEHMYSKRFKNRYYLVPFYEGNMKNVIPVYECSYQFQGYLSQGFSKFYDEKYAYYFVIADDMIINPAINDSTFRDFFKLESNSAYISYWQRLTDWVYGFERIENAMVAYQLHKGVNALEELPEKEEAFKRAARLGYNDFSLQKKSVFIKNLSYNLKYWTSSRSRFHLLARILLGITSGLDYPFMCAYSDIFIVPQNTMREFCRICGIFAAMRLHVETAVPTALLLTQNQILTNADINRKEHLMWDRNERKILGELCDWKVSKLIENWDEDRVCLHPIKLSQWED